MRGHFSKDQGYSWPALVLLESAGEIREFVRTGFGLGLDSHNFASYPFVVLGSDQSDQDACCGASWVYVPGVNFG